MLTDAGRELLEERGLELEEYDDEPQDPRLAVEVQIAGKHVAIGAPAMCEHDQFMAEPLFACIHENADGSGRIVRWQAKLKVRCALCGLPFVFRFDTTAPSRSDAEFGLVVDLEPAAE